MRILKEISIIRFLFHGVTRAKNADGSVRNIGIADTAAFYFVAQAVAKDYKTGDKRFVKIITASDIVRKINACSVGYVAKIALLLVFE